MTIETLSLISYYVNATKMSHKEREAFNGVVLEAIIHGDDIDIQAAMRKYRAVDNGIKEFMDQIDCGVYGAEELYKMYCKQTDSPVTMTRFGREVKSLGIAFERSNSGIKYTIGGANP